MPAGRGAARSVLATAAGLLARRDYSVLELRRALERRGFEAAAVQSALEQLCERGALDDRRYAQHFVNTRAERGQGPVRIGRELAELGLTEALIDAALAEVGDWEQRARTLRLRRFGREPPGSWPERARQARFLQYRGFSIDHIRSALGPNAPADT